MSARTRAEGRRSKTRLDALPQGAAWEEHTYTRVLLAERLRRRLARGVFGECEATFRRTNPLGAPPPASRDKSARAFRGLGEREHHDWPY